MRVAIVYFESGCTEVLKTAKSLAEGIISGDNMVDLINGETDSYKKLTAYQYIVIGASPISFFTGEISEKVGEYLNSSGMLSGKRSYAFIRKKGLGSTKALRNLMMEMEKEGMMIKISDVLYSTAEAKSAGQRLHIKK